MCYGCWQEVGAPQIITEKTVRAAILIGHVYQFSSVGGNLHCEIDDWNLEDRFFNGDFDPFNPDVSRYQLNAERKAYEALKALTHEERASALALHEGFCGDGFFVLPTDTGVCQ